MTIAVKDANGTTQNINPLPAAGQALAAASLPVVIASDQSAVPISATALPLPTGAATAANQSSEMTLVGPVTETAPATDTASSGLNGRMQRIAQRLSALIALLPTALGAGGGLKVDGSGTALPVSASALPLPTGASTAAKQPALGTAGASATDVLSVQGIAGGTPMPVTLSNVNANGQATSALSAPVVGASDWIPNSPRATSTGNGTTSSRINAAATTNATSLKTSAGQLYGIDVFNVAAYDVFLKLYNKSSAPTVGTDTPAWTIPIKSGAGYSNVFTIGKTFSSGIAYAITKLQDDSDTTAISAGDVTGNMDWI